jgi:hypothetical protein
MTGILQLCQFHIVGTRRPALCCHALTMFRPSAATVPLPLKTPFMVLMPSMNSFHGMVSVPPLMGRAAADRCVSLLKNCRVPRHSLQSDWRHLVTMKNSIQFLTLNRQPEDREQYFIPADAPRPPFLINTLLQRGVWRPKSIRNRFNGFHSARETVETVPEVLPACDTPLKRGVNESASCRAW